MRFVAHLLMVVLLVTGCASTSPNGGPRPPRANTNVLTLDQLKATNSSILWDAITKLRPEWLNTRGPSSVTDPTPTMASVFMNNSNLGRIESLKDINVLDVMEVRFWPAAQASARFGQGHPRGVIELIRK